MASMSDQPKEDARLVMLSHFGVSEEYRVRYCLSMSATLHENVSQSDSKVRN